MSANFSEPMADESSMKALDGGAILDVHSSMEREWAFVRRSVGWLDLSWRRFAAITGSERAEFLHGMTTNHVLNLRPWRSQQNTVCNVTGHMEGVMRLVNRGDQMMADTHPTCFESSLAILDRHLIMEDVQITREPDLGVLSLQGPLSARVLQQMDSALIPPQHGEVVNWSARGVILICWSHTGEYGVDLVGPRQSLRDLQVELDSAVQNCGGGRVGFQALQVLRTEAGIPWWGEDLDSSVLMLEAGLEDAIHFQKGCYLGQETLARVHHRGHTNRQLIGLILEREVAPRGTRLIAGGRDAGRITTSVQSPALKKPIALAFVRREFLNPGTQLQTETAEQSAIVHGLPLLSGGEMDE